MDLLFLRWISDHNKRKHKICIERSNEQSYQVCFQRRGLKCKRLWTIKITDTKCWQYFTWPFGSGEVKRLLKCKINLQPEENHQPVTSNLITISCKSIHLSPVSLWSLFNTKWAIFQTISWRKQVMMKSQHG
jgi:hypothetical protein